MVSRANKKQNDNIHLTHATILIRQIDGVYGAQRVTEKAGKPV